MDAAQPLRASALFADLAETEYSAVLRNAHRLAVPARRLVLGEGEGDDSLYVIESGQARVFVASDGGAEITVDILTAGDFFGELAALTAMPRSASVMTMTPCMLWQIGQGCLADCLCHRAAVDHLLAVTGRRLRYTTELARQLGLMSSPQRIARVLVNLAERHGGPCADGIGIDLVLHQADLADLTGTSRETVNRVLHQLHEQGLVYQASRDRFVVMDIDGLRRAQCHGSGDGVSA